MNAKVISMAIAIDPGLAKYFLVTGLAAQLSTIPR
jgi:hypothetical protein